MQQDTIQRSALGNPMSLGQLYNARTEKSCNVSILTETPPAPNFINSTEKPNTESDYVHVKSIKDKFHSLNVAAELQVSLLAGLIQVSGSGKYFREERTSARSVSVSLVHKITTKHENLSILDKKFRQIININALKHRNATHVVTGITWGANLIVTAEYNNDEKKDEEDIAGKLSVHLKKGDLEIQGSASVGIKSSENLDKSKLQLKIVGDVLIPGQIPRTIEDAMVLVGKLSEQTKKYNDGKGVPVLYELTSLEAIQSYFTLSNVTTNLLHTLEEHTIVRVTAIFDEITEAKLKLNDFCDDVQKYKNNLSKDMQAETRKLKQEAEAAESEFRGQLQKLLVDVRSGEGTAADLEALKKNYESRPYSAASILQQLQIDFHDTQLKIGELRTYAATGIQVVSKDVRSLPLKLLEFQGKQVYVLFGESKSMKQDMKLWDDQFAALRRLIAASKETDDNVFLYVDLDTTDYLRPHQQDDENRKICIQKFDQHGKCIDTDVYKTLMREMSLCYVKSLDLNKTSVKSNYGSVFELLCPESLFGQPHSHQWNCFDCKTVIRWDLDEFLYCSCGVGRIDSYQFLCSHSTSLATNFCRFPPEILKQVLEVARQPKRQIAERATQKNEPVDTTDYNSLILRKARHMLRPLVEAFKNTLENMRIAKEHRNLLKDKAPEQKLRIPICTLKITALQTTRIVCASPSCVKYCKTKNESFFCKFPRVCKGPLNFRLSELPFRLQRESILKETSETTERQSFFSCTSCNCPWLLHMPERFTVEATDGFQDETQNQVDALSNDAIALNLTDIRIQQLEKELKKIYEACVGMEMITAISLNGYPISYYLSWLIENYEENNMMTTEQKKATLSYLKWFNDKHEYLRAEIALDLDTNKALGAFDKKYYDDLNKNIQHWYDLPINGETIKQMAEVQEFRWKQSKRVSDAVPVKETAPPVDAGGQIV